MSASFSTVPFHQVKEDTWYRDGGEVEMDVDTGAVRIAS
jgi:hypothetical protein